MKAKKAQEKTQRRKNALRSLLLFCYLFPLCLYAAGTDRETLGCCAVACAVHEAGHICAAWLCGRRVRGLCMTPGGLFLSLETGKEREAVIIYAAGPAANFAACAVCAAVSCGTGGSESALRLFCANLIPAIFNLLPLPYADGDGILGILLLRARSARIGRSVRLVLRVGVALCFFSVASYRFFWRGTGLFPFALSSVLLFSSVCGGLDNPCRPC